MKKEKKTQGKH